MSSSTFICLYVTAAILSTALPTMCWQNKKWHEESIWDEGKAVLLTTQLTDLAVTDQKKPHGN